MSRGLHRCATAVVATGFVACAAGVVWRWPGAATAIAAALAALLAVFGGRAWQHARVASALRHGSQPDRIAGVALRWRSFAARAAVAGLARPTVFCDPTVRDELTPDELRAVVLHERHHQLCRDPLRLVALAALGPLAAAVPGGRRWVAQRRAQVEIDADRFALAHGASRPRLASALLKLGTAEPSGSLAGYTCASDARLRWLVQGSQAESVSLRPRRRLLASIGIAGVGVAGCALGWAQHALATAGDVGVCAWPGC